MKSAFRAEGLNVSMIGSPPLFQLPLFKISTSEGPLLGHTAGPMDDDDFPGAINHSKTLLRFPTLFSRESEWIDKYIATLNKIISNLNELTKWENDNKL